MSETKSENWMLRVEKIAEDACLVEGCFLYDIEFSGKDHQRTLRLYIDKDTGSTIGDCSNVSKALNTILDADDIIPGGEYTLEVSTPGLDRSLKKAWHFEKVVGKKIWIKLHKSLEAAGISQGPMKLAKQLEKELMTFEANQIVLDLDGHLTKIPLELVEKAKLVIDIPSKDDGRKQKIFKKK